MAGHLVPYAIKIQSNCIIFLQNSLFRFVTAVQSSLLLMVRQAMRSLTALMYPAISTQCILKHLVHIDSHSPSAPNYLLPVLLSLSASAVTGILECP